MTLAEFAQHVCEVVGMTDDESVALCKKFVARRYKLIWEKHPWRETLDVVSYTQFTEADRQELVFTGASHIERVLQVCKGDAELLGPVEFTSVWLNEPAAFASSMGGVAMGFTLRRLSASLTSRAILAADITATLGVVDTGLEEGKTITLEGLDWTSKHFCVTCPAGTDLTTHAASGDPPGLLLGPIADLTLTAGPIELWSARCNVNSTGVSIILNTGAYGVCDIAPGELSAPLYPALRLWTELATGETLRVLGKIRCPELVLDDASPMLPNIDEALISYAQGDMLERQRQYAKAAAKKAEGEAMVQTVMKDLQRRQTADGFQIIPAMEPDAGGEGLTGKGWW